MSISNNKSRNKNDNKMLSISFIYTKSFFVCTKHTSKKKSEKYLLMERAVTFIWQIVKPE